ncbi:MAG: hypothetical protein Q8941_02630 [Bacteroidota bacterium]|nr:hypothetical protein [Bacteroidota bacterium]
MSKDNTKQEILLVTASSFMQRDLCENGFSKSKPASPGEKLEEACWNGLWGDWLKGTISDGMNRERLFLWKTHVADTFLYIQLSQKPATLNHMHSLDPYLFLPFKNIN